MSRYDELETFVRVVEAGSFSAAAERLQRAKSAVSRRVGELEERLGARLLNRTTRRLSLTEAGQRFYERALRLLADLEEAEQAVAGDEGELRGRLRVAAPLSFGVLHLAPVVAGFLEQNPQTSLELDLNDRVTNLVEEGFDMAVRIGRLGDSSLVARRLAPARLIVCASPDYLRRYGEPNTPEELAGHQGLVYANLPEAQHWQFEDAQGRVRPVKVPTRLRANNGDLLLRAAAKGAGIVVVPTFLAVQALERREVVPILREFRLPASTVYAVYPSQRLLPRRVRLFIETLAECFGGDPPYWDRCLEMGV